MHNQSQLQDVEVAVVKVSSAKPSATVNMRIRPSSAYNFFHIAAISAWMMTTFSSAPWLPLATIYVIETVSIGRDSHDGRQANNRSSL
jgi:hypothetical protein